MNELDAKYEEWEEKELENQGGVYPRAAWLAGYRAAIEEAQKIVANAEKAHSGE